MEEKYIQIEIVARVYESSLYALPIFMPLP